MAVVFPMLNKLAIGHVFFEMVLCYEVVLFAIYLFLFLTTTCVWDQKRRFVSHILRLSGRFMLKSRKTYKKSSIKKEFFVVNSK